MIGLQVVYAAGRPLSGAKLEIRLFSKHGASKLVQGNPAVEQNFVKLLLTDPGTDQFNPALGSGLNRLLGQDLSAVSIVTRRTQIAQAISRVERQIIASQAGTLLPAAERLLSVTNMLINLQADELSWKISFNLNMEDGNVLRVLLGD